MNRFRYYLVGGVIIHLLSLFLDVGIDVSCNLAIAPIALGALALGAGAAMNSVANEQNRRNAEYSLDLEKKLLDYQWRNFNSPKAQAQSLADIGINPSVAFGQGGMRGIAPSGGAPELAQSPVPMTGEGLANTILALSQAKKAGSEAAGVELDNVVKSKTLDDAIKSAALANKWTAEQTAKITQEIGLMSGQFNEIQQNIENMRSEKLLTDKKVEWFDRHMSAEIQHLKSSAEYQDALKNLTDEQKELLDRTMDDLCNITSYQSQQLEKIVGLLDKYGDAQAIVGMLSQVVGSATDLIGTFYKPLQVAKKIVKVE